MFNYQQRSDHRQTNTQIRVFISPHRGSRRVSNRRLRSNSSEFQRFIASVRKDFQENENCFKRKKNVFVLNYKPTFVNQEKEEKKTVPPPPPKVSNLPLTSQDLPDAEDPLVFIEQMYQQLFTEDGQLRQETEKNHFANRFKQMVTNSRRNSSVHRDSITSSIHQLKSSTPSSWFHQNGSIPSSRFVSNAVSEAEEEETETMRHSHLLNSTSRKKQQPTAQFLRASSLNNSHHHASFDDTDHEDFDHFSDFIVHQKVSQRSHTASLDNDSPRTESKNGSSSGYQSMKSQSSPSCSQPANFNAIHFLQRIQSPIRNILNQCLRFIFVSKHIFLLPVFVFFIEQRNLLMIH